MAQKVHVCIKEHFLSHYSLHTKHQFNEKVKLELYNTLECIQLVKWE